MQENLKIGQFQIPKGSRQRIELGLARLYDFTELSLPVEVIRGKEDGPTFLVSGAIHGDEIVGAAIIKRLIRSKRLKHLKGTLIAIPILNVFGFNNKSRYFPDRRDLNRSFPGSKNGSLASRVAHLFVNEIVKKCDYGIDFHSGAIHRVNLPQIRMSLDSEEDNELAKSFGVPVVIDSRVRDGSLRACAKDMGLKMLLFEGGEALRIEERVVKIGVRGALSVMEKVGMLPPVHHSEDTMQKTYFANSSTWVRAPQSGMIRFTKKLGSHVEEGSPMGVISDAFGQHSVSILSPSDGVIIGQSQIPLVNKGDGVFHLATFKNDKHANELAEDLIDFDIID